MGPHLLSTFQSILQNRRSVSALRALTLPLPTTVDFSSNDFLSLSTSPLLRTTLLQHLRNAPPTTPFGSRGSRLLDGNSSYAEALETDIAAYHNAPAGLIFNSGYDANSGFFACVVQAGDVVVFDEYVHASAREGMRLSRAGRRVGFQHNSLEGLRGVLGECMEGDERVRGGERNVFVAVESVYSMDGDLAPLREFVVCMEEMLPAGNGYLVVDEAHATGVVGPGGRGLVCELGIEDRVFARLHTFGKALGCSGGMYCPPRLPVLCVFESELNLGLMKNGRGKRLYYARR
ncbi:putative secondary metabolism biosynthetic enzyme [Glutinoglossum americanum]|uniref:Secondary metabolism biosynthetic enzyme n=1 Tax=Glutinoglossum americanum TaxID=1670608 RepID=A0A9P8I0Q3_9PEZI|nr:putative secondary metabolism biosynthetic enzyme [Glutinoglossum americanum]